MEIMSQTCYNVNNFLIIIGGVGLKEAFKQISLLRMFFVSLFSCIFLILISIGLAKILGADTNLIAKFLGSLGLYLGPIIVLYRTLHKNNLSMKLWFQPARIRIRETLAGAIFPEMLGVGILLFISILFISFSALPTDKNLNSSTIDTTYWVQYFILSCLLAPFCEEILFRGFLFEKLQFSYSVKKSIIITSLVFGLMHGISGISPTIVSFVLCVLYKKYHSLIPCIAIHFVHNFLAILLKYLVASASTMESTSNTASPLSPMDIVFIVFLISIGLIWLIRFIKANWKYTYSNIENETSYEIV